VFNAYLFIKMWVLTRKQLWREEERRGEGEEKRANTQ
jgi:hypothetical protein